MYTLMRYFQEKIFLDSGMALLFSQQEQVAAEYIKNPAVEGTYKKVGKNKKNNTKTKTKQTKTHKKNN